MSDNRYSTQAHGQHSSSYHSDAYATSNTHSSRSSRAPVPYGQEHPKLDGPGQHSSYSNSYSNSQRPMSPSHPSYSQGTYNSHASRPGSSSVTAQQASFAPNGHSQHPSLTTNGGHYRSYSQTYSKEYSSSNQHGYQYNGQHSGHTSNYSHRSPTPPTYSGGYYSQSPDMPDQVPASPLRPFPCDMCALSFNRQHDLKRHKETHTGERPFLCNGGCGKTFTRKDALKRHQVGSAYTISYILI